MVAGINGVAACGHSPAASGAVQAPARPALVRDSAAVAVSVPAPPVPVRAAGREALVYELHVSNVGSRPLRLDRIDVRDAEQPNARPLATYAPPELARSLKLLGPRGAAPPNALRPGVRAIVYLWLALDSSAVLPRALTHRVVFTDGDSVDAAPVPVRAPADGAVASPVGAGDWWIGLGPSNTSEHRREVLRVGADTVPHLAQRFAIDWVKMDAKGGYARDQRGRRNTDWYSYGEPVLAVADARVAAVVDSIPDNTPGEDSRAVPIVVSTVFGNYVLLDLGPTTAAAHRFALYGHLKAGSLRVRIGDAVSRGQILGAIGNSGNSDGPHLHFQVTEAADAAAAPLRGEGTPFVLDSFTVVTHDPERVAQHAALTALGLHRAALPVEGDVIRVGGTPP
jgi:hypothetical protein